MSVYMYWLYWGDEAGDEAVTTWHLSPLSNDHPLLRSCWAEAAPPLVKSPGSFHTRIPFCPSLQSQCPVSSARIRPGQCYHCNTQSVGEEYSVNQSFTSVKNNWRPDWALKCFIVDNQRFQLRFESSLTGRSEQDHNPSKECKFFEEI